MRTLASAAVIGFCLALAACNQAQQDKTQADANNAASSVKENSQEIGQDVKEGASKVGAEIKDVTQDPQVKAAAGEAKDALKNLGASINSAARDDHSASTSATTTNADGSTTTTTTTTTTKR